MPSQTTLLPNLPIPAPLRGIEIDTFGRYTITQRLPKIVRLVLEQTDWPAPVAGRLLALLAEIPHSPLLPVPEDGGPDTAAWQADLQPYLGQSWLWAPWFVVEMYFFRRILEATSYYRPGPTQGLDPYTAEKRAGQAGVAERLRGLLDESAHLDAQAAAGLARLLRLCLWGNQADLSMWPAGSATQPGRPQNEGLTDRLVADQSLAAGEYLVAQRQRPGRIDFVLDNVGLELAYDLALADFLLHYGLARAVRLHAKLHPTYVSDATPADVRQALTALAASADPALNRLGQRLLGALGDGRLQIHAHFFWTSPLAGWETPPDLRQELGEAALLITKGDANYRRWLGDRHWSFAAPLDDLLAYLPAPWLALRVFKAEIAAGLEPMKAPEMERRDPHWLNNGHWGMIQFKD